MSKFVRRLFSKVLRKGDGGMGRIKLGGQDPRAVNAKWLLLPVIAAKTREEVRLKRCRRACVCVCV